MASSWLSRFNVLQIHIQTKSVEKLKKFIEYWSEISSIVFFLLGFELKCKMSSIFLSKKEALQKNTYTLILDVMLWWIITVWTRYSVAIQRDTRIHWPLHWLWTRAWSIDLQCKSKQMALVKNRWKWEKKYEKKQRRYNIIRWSILQSKFSCQSNSADKLFKLFFQTEQCKRCFLCW